MVRNRKCFDTLCVVSSLPFDFKTRFFFSKSIHRNLKSLTGAKQASFTPPLGAWGERKKADYLFCIHYIHWNFPLFPATGNSYWKVIHDVRFSVTLQSRSPFSASLQTFCLTAGTYLNRQKYGLFCSLLGLTAMRYLYLNLWTVCSWFIAFMHAENVLSFLFLAWFLKIRELIKAEDLTFLSRCLILTLSDDYINDGRKSSLQSSQYVSILTNTFTNKKSVSADSLFYVIGFVKIMRFSSKNET